MEYFKTRRFLATLFLSVTLAVGCVATILVTRMLGQWNVFKEKALPSGYLDEVDTAVAQGEDEMGAQASWVVRAHDEKIGVFDINGELEYVVDVYLITLPQADQELLKQGIHVSDEAELAALMEDYTG